MPGRRVRTTDAEATPWGVYTAVLVGVVILVAVGMAGVLSLGSDGAGPIAPEPVASAVDPTVVPDTASWSPEPRHVYLADIAAVDLRSGKSSALPRSIRRVLGARHFRVSPTGTEIAFDDGESIFVANIDGSHVRRFTPEEGGGVSAPAWSPDGSKIVFSEANSAFILDIDTGRIARLVDERRPVWYPNFSPDGRTILYTTLRHWVLTLRTVPADGGPSSHVIRGAFGAYSPDGTTIAYRQTSYDGSDATEMTSGSLWLADADGSHAYEIGLPAGWMSQIDPEALWPMWSPDGTKIAYQPTYKSAVRVIDIGLDRGSEVGDGIDPGWLNDHTLIITDFQPANPRDPYFSLANIVSVDVRTGQPKPLSKDIRSIPGVRHLRASHDGTMIAFEDGSSIFVANIDGTHLQRFTPKLGVSAPSWSPDGSTLVFSEGNIAFTLDIDTGRTSTLVRERGTIWYPNFSPDGDTVLYTTVRHGALTLRTIPATGGRSSHLTRGAFGAFSPDGTSIAYRKTQFDGIDVTEMTSGAMWLADPDGSHPRKLGRSCCWMSQMDPEALWLMWSADGSMIAYQPLYKSPIKVIGVRFGQVRKVGNGADPSWLDDHTLIITDFKEIGS